MRISLIPFDASSMRLAQGPLYEKAEQTLWFAKGNPFNASEFELHLLVITVFIAFVAPFGGFMFSGLKRAMRSAKSVKNNRGLEGSSVITRLECIIMSGCFMLMYMNMLVFTSTSAAESGEGPQAVLSMLDYMSEDAQKELYYKLKADLLQGI